MALNFNTPTGLNSVQQQLVGHVAPAPAPSASVAPSNNGGSLNGAMYYDSGTGTIQEYNGNGWSPTGTFDGVGSPNTRINSPPAQTSAAPAVVRPSAAQVNPLLASLNSLQDILTNKNAQSQQEHDAAIAGYNANDAIDGQAHDQNVQQNESTYAANNQKALLNAANGASGLRGVLSSLGALGGSGMDIVNHLVGLAANTDAGDARHTFDANSSALNSAWAKTDQAEKQRRLDADSTLQNNEQNNQAGVLNSKQNIYQQLANLYTDKTPEGNDYAAKAAELAPQIAATTKASVAPYAAGSPLYTPQALQQYLAGTQNLNVKTDAPTTPINSPLFPTSVKKDSLQGVA